MLPSPPFPGQRPRVIASQMTHKIIHYRRLSTRPAPTTLRPRGGGDEPPFLNQLHTKVAIIVLDLAASIPTPTLHFFAPYWRWIRKGHSSTAPNPDRVHLYAAPVESSPSPFAATPTAVAPVGAIPAAGPTNPSAETPEAGNFEPGGCLSVWEVIQSQPALASWAGLIRTHCSTFTGSAAGRGV